jgi:hypothetical protein
VGVPGTPASRLVPAKHFATPESQKALVDAIFQGLNTAPFKQILISSPYRYSKSHSGEDVSYTPAWRDAVWQVVTGFFWDYDTDVATVKTQYQAASAAIQPVRDLTPDSGAYHAEADAHEPDHEGETPPLPNSTGTHELAPPTSLFLGFKLRSSITNQAEI